MGLRRRIFRTGKDDLGFWSIKVCSFQYQTLSGCITGERGWMVTDKVKLVKPKGGLMDRNELMPPRNGFSCQHNHC